MNPKAAIDSLLQAKKDVLGCTIYPLTLARYALLELVDSPLTQQKQTVTTVQLMPTMFIMTQPIEKLAQYDSDNIKQLKAEAAIWADGISTVQASAIVQETCKQFGLIAEVAPDASEGDGKTSKKAQTAGC